MIEHPYPNGTIVSVLWFSGLEIIDHRAHTLSNGDVLHDYQVKFKGVKSWIGEEYLTVIEGDES